MKKGTNKFLVSALALLLAISVVVAPFLAIEKVNAKNGGSWTTLTPLPTPISSYSAHAFALNGKIYCVGANVTLCYDPETNNWTQLTPPPIPKAGVYAAYQNKIYVIGGSSDYPTQVYDPATDTWENRTSFHGTNGIVQANVVDGKIYVMGGQYSTFPSTLFPVRSNYVYDPETDNWSQMAPLPVGVGGYASAVVDDKIYIIGGGYEAAPDYKATDLVQIFDPATNQWTNGTSIPTPVYNARACVITEPSGEKRIHVIGGQVRYYWYDRPYVGVDLHQVYDPETDTWTNATAMPTPRTGLGLAAINNEIYAIGGEHKGNLILANEKYTPSGYIPEFPSWSPVLLGVVALVSMMVVYRKKLKKLRGWATA